ncbi:MAG TPA: ATP-binding protein [Kofleriaceae bacterium]|nr:ATP-binding protein [Kofleriaceae bacterium]
MPRPPAIPERALVNATWLARLRWAEIAGQAATLLVATRLVASSLPWWTLLVLVNAGAVSNVVLELWLRRRPAVRDWHVAGIMALDVGLLTALLYLTGGPLNPFGVLYLVQIALATVLVPAVFSWALVALSFACFGLLLVAHRPLVISERVHTVGMWVALGVASAFIVTFLFRVTTALAERERELEDERNLTARQERLASLATMAAGAAHELATPLGTVALVAKELERHLDGVGDPNLVEDAKLIRREVGRCRAILDQMAGGAGAAGESMSTVTMAAIVEEALTGARPEPKVVLQLADAGAATIRLPARAVSQALRSLITNAQDASGPANDVVVTGAIRAEVLAIDIADRGPGMSPELLARIGEPFFTTKQPGRGMGLGLFLSRAVFESIGGAMLIDSTPGQGTRITVTVPVDVEARARRRPRGESPPVAG